MGRPLLSTLIAPAEPAVRVAEVHTPTYERWSYVNAFDPDADEFFEGENVVYEAFLTPEEVTAAAAASASLPAVASQTTEPQSVPEPESGYMHATAMVLAQAGIRSREAQAFANLRPAGEDDRPELVASEEDDASSVSDFSSSGRTSPTLGDLAQLFDARSRDMERAFAARYPGDLDLSGDNSDDLAGLSPAPLPVSAQSQARSLPATPTRTRRREDTWAPIPRPTDVDLSYIPVPASPMPAPARAVSSPMTPPGSVTPRFLSWSSRPRAVDMSPSPTPDAPFGSARAALAYIAPPVLRA
ncbi:hypothetical protein M0805_008863 [Coniferiporia weirii]|nr:hypothetical protein M0805_008863 [Coniferiporia weirii]